MIKAVIFAALGCAVVGALSGNRTAWVLTPLVGACLLADAYDVAFRPEYWLGADAAAMVLIVGIHPRLERSDWAILLLFPLTWLFYLLPDPLRYIGSNLITITQLMLTFPALVVLDRIKHTQSVESEGDGFDIFEFKAARVNL